MDTDGEKEEYELQHFNFSSKEIVAENIQMVQILLHKTLSEFTEQLIKKQQIPQASADQLRASCSKTSIAMYNDCLPAIDALNVLYQQTFSIPDNVLLPTDLLQTRGQTQELVDELMKEVQSAKQAVMQGAVFLASLDAEVEFHRALEQCYESEELVVEQLQNFQEEEVDSEEVSDLVKRLEIAGIIKDDWERESAELDNFLLQK